MIATNIRDRAALHSTLIEQTSDYFRTYVDHSWRRLEPGLTDATRIWFESLAGDPIADVEFQREFWIASQERGLTNDLTARAFILPDDVFDGARERWGVELAVRAGIRTFVHEAHGRGELVRGRISAENGDVVPGGAVRLVGWPKSRPEAQVHSDGQLNGLGEFALPIPSVLVGAAQQETVLLAVYYHGTARFTPCHSDEFQLRM